MRLLVTTEGNGLEQNTYKVQRIHVGVLLYKVFDVTILHPHRYRHKLILGHRDTQQWQYVRMAEGSPCHNLLAEPLRNTISRRRT